MGLETGASWRRASLGASASSAVKGIHFILKSRWHNHLNPDIKKDRWTEKEDLEIIEAHRM
jgi:hypothetical protein